MLCTKKYKNVSIHNRKSRKKVAGKQFYKCANKPDTEIPGLKDYKCPLWKINGIEKGDFDEKLKS